MEKILKKYTTIPEHLYVNRDADDQLRKIIEEMQRPGYVLVARQMGKTNLLFNAKRTLENHLRLFVYVDLSNLYDNERDCYRNIINNIIEPNFQLFELIENEIEEIRNKNLPPHNEYSRCLRTILHHFKGDLVIVLDEIDALKTVSYSDNIFAQIRSNYFSRTNFPVFERLTYVLSGVIEPIELIKDRNKSPFNIGDKIYLDDFTKEEFNAFIEKSKLKISTEISNEIFSWTNGNPRLTFDVCSDVENYIINEGTISKEELDDIIKKKYLTTFDIAPIDHIRDLVKANKQIIKSIIQIRKKHTADLSDEIKKKLYLYGIINSKFDKEIKIKNRIIENCLSEDWIRSIEKEDEISFVYGLAKYHARNFSEAIDIFNSVISNSNSLKKDIEGSYYFIGLSLYQIGEYERSIEYFTRDFSPEYFVDSQAFLGISKIATGNKEEGIKILTETIKNERNNYAFRTAVLNLAINTEDPNISFDLFVKLFDSTFKSDKDDNQSEDDLNQLRTLALYYQSDILLTQTKREESLNKIIKALEYSNSSDSLFLQYIKYNLSEVKDDSIKFNLVHTIIDNDLLLNNTTSPLIFNEPTLLYYLDFVFNKSDLEIFEKLLHYSLLKLLPNLNKYELLYKVSLISSLNRQAILNLLISFEDEIEKTLLFDIYKTITYTYTNDKTYLSFFNKYCSLLPQNKTVKGDDIYLFALAIKLYYENQKFTEALKLCFIIENQVYGIEDEKLKFESVIIYYWFAILYFELKEETNTQRYIDITLDLIDSSIKKNTSMIDDKGVNTIREQLIQIKKTPSPNTISISKKYNRNDKIKVEYSNGQIIEKKYKFLEDDIKSLKCKIL